MSEQSAAPSPPAAPGGSGPPSPLAAPTTDGARQDRRLFRRALAINFASLLGKGFWPLFLYLVPRWHGAAALGQFLLLAAASELLQALCNTGFVDGLYRHVARLPDEPLDAAGYGAVRLALRAALSAGAALTLAAALGGEAALAWAWNRPELAAPLGLMAAAVPLAGATSILLATSSAAMRNEGEALIKHALAPLTTLLAAWLTAGAARGALALAAGYLLAQAVALVAAAAVFARRGSLRRLCRWTSADDDAVDRRAQRRAGLAQGLNVMLWAGVYNFDTLLLGVFARDSQVALYRAASELTRVLQYVRTQVSAAYVPLAGRYLRQGQVQQLGEVLRALSVALARSGLLLAGLLAHLAPPLLDAMLPAARGVDVGFVKLLLAGHVVVTALALAGNTLVAGGQQRLLLQSSALMTALHLSLGVALIPAWGLGGAATATLAAMTAAMALQAAALRRAVGVSLALRPLARVTAEAALAFGASLAAARWLAVPGPWSAPWRQALTGALGFAGCFAAAGALALLRSRNR